MEHRSNDATLRDFVRIIFQHKYLVVFTIIPIVLFAYVSTEFKTPRYSAVVKLLVAGQKQTEAGHYREMKGGWITWNHAEILKSKPVIERVVKALKLHTIPADYEKQFASPLKRFFIEHYLKKRQSSIKKLKPEQKEANQIDSAVANLTSRVSVTPVPETNIILISVSDFNPYFVTKIANSISRSYIIYDLVQQLAEYKLRYGDKHATVMQLKEYIKESYKNLDGKQLSVLDALGPASVKVVEQAQLMEPGGRSKRGVLFVSVLASLLLGIVLSLVIGFFDQRFKSSHDLESFLGLPFLGTILRTKNKSRLFVGDFEQESNYSQNYSKILEQIHKLKRNSNLKTILIVDLGSSKETALFAANLASYFSTDNARDTLLVDADSYNQTLTKYFNCSENLGLIDILKGKASIFDVISDINGKLKILPAGTEKNSLKNIVLSKDIQTFKAFKEEIDNYEMVFVHCAGLNNCQDAVVWSPLVDGIIILINEEKDRRQVVSYAIAPLIQAKSNILGVILTNHKYVIPEFIYKNI